MLNVHFPPERPSALAKDYSLAHINPGTHPHRAGALSSARYLLRPPRRPISLSCDAKRKTRQ